ncbi:MAG: GNAT family N-acetyltransferase [Candidatus Cybelea sp.]
MGQLGYDVAPAAIAGRLARRAEREIFVAVVDERVAGWAAVCAREPFVEGLGAYLEGLVVEESMRSSGIGANLLDAAETWARKRGCTEMHVHSNVVRDRAHAFYRRCGYATLKAQYYFRKPL